MLFSDGLFWLSQKLFLPMTTLFLLLTYGGSIAENGLLQKAAGLVRWGLQKLIRIFLAAYFAYLSLTGLVTGAADSAAVRTAQAPASAVVITTERDAPQATPVPETETPEPTATPEQTPAPDTAEATCVASRKAKKYHRPSCQYAAKIKDENLVTFDSIAQAQAADYAPCGACKP